jgi:hypothetical protein
MTLLKTLPRQRPVSSDSSGEGGCAWPLRTTSALDLEGGPMVSNGSNHVHRGDQQRPWIFPGSYLPVSKQDMAAATLEIYLPCAADLTAFLCRHMAQPPPSN